MRAPLSRAMKCHFSFGKVDRRSHGDHGDGSGPGLFQVPRTIYSLEGRAIQCICVLCVFGGGEEGAGVIPMKTNIKFLISPGNMSLKIDLMSDKNKDNIFLTLRLTEQFTAATQLSNTKQEKLGI